MVSLEGEAYFEVAKDKEKPFIVKANGINVQAVNLPYKMFFWMKFPASLLRITSFGLRQRKSVVIRCV